MLPPTERFSNRVADYVRARPSYPVEVISLLIEKCGLGSNSVVADVGCGTGIFSQQLLTSGATVVGVEPNQPMRDAAVAMLAGDSCFSALDGTSEATGLADGSVGLVTAAQAFHWFDQDKAFSEFIRILRPKGQVCLVWNERKMTGSAFLDGYEKILKELAPEYAFVKHRNNADSAILNWYRNDEAKVYIFSNDQLINLDGLLGRAFSSSYVPAAETSEGAIVEKELRRLFDTTNEDGFVRFEYETKAFLGMLG